MVNISKFGDSAIKFKFTDNDHYLFNGEIEVPINSLLLVLDESDMVTFKKIDGDPFVSFLISNSNFASKNDLENFYKTSMVGSTGGGSESGITSGDVESMIEASLEDYYDIDEIDAALSGKADSSSVYTKSEVDAALDDKADSSAVTEAITAAVSGKADTSAVTEEISAAVSGKADTSAVTEAINSAVSGKADASDVETALSAKQDISGMTAYTTSSDVETYVTGYTYDKATIDSKVASGGTFDPTNYYDKTAVDGLISGFAETTAVTEEISAAVSGKADSSDVTEAINAAVSGKADSSSVYTKSEVDTALSGKADSSSVYTKSEVDTALSGKQDTLIAGSGITISGNVISATGGGGGGKAVSGGTNISITTGETSDTINCTLNLENGTNSQSGGIKQKSNAGSNYVNGRDACAFGCGNKADGTNSFVTGAFNIGSIGGDFVSGYENKTTNRNETLFGMCALSNGSQTSDMNGNSGCTLFAVGNGEWRSQTKHNAIDIRQNGDIYIVDTNDTSTINWYSKPMIKLQDALGGGGGVSESAFTSYSAATDARMAEDEEVTAAALNALNDKFDGLRLKKLTQAEYEALTVKDNNTLYILVG